MFRKGFWVKPAAALLSVLLLTTALLAGCQLDPGPAIPNVPAAPTVTAGNGQLGVSWTAVNEATAYEVYYHTANTPASAGQFGGDITTTSTTITSLTNGTTYYVWVKAKNTAGVSDFSPATSGTPSSTTTLPAVEIPAALAGYFQSLPYSADYAFYDDGFVVDATAKTFYYYGNSTFTKKWGGAIVKIVPEDDASVMIVRVDEVTGTWTPAPDVGKYYAAAYKNLTSFAVDSNTAYKAGGNNTGTATLEEAENEYTIANGYFDYLGTTQYYPHTTSAVTLAPLQGKWENGDIEDYYIDITGTKLTEWYADGDGLYVATDDESMLAELGDIVDSTNASQAEGVLYVKVIASDMGFGVDKYIAVAWKDLNGSGVSFQTGGGPGNTGYETLAAVKAALNDAANEDQFPAAGWYAYEK